MKRNETILYDINDYLAQRDNEEISDSMEEDTATSEDTAMDEDMAMEDSNVLFVSVKDFIRISGLSEYFVRRLLKIKEFPKLRCGRMIKIPLNDAHQWLLKREDIATEYPAFFG
ncbi:helix-turn-helix domain-containing protein [Anaerovibrio sp. RM50]|uniref:helix-turn-helix domain-containing protein n=1 Tax=Anaerovibrio sp. RM50 TaxID=1200557 RepID=UPI00048860A5|nr:helix-turn-helix domain-containing protein [Anaerovibrio sp. RM50]